MINCKPLALELCIATSFSALVAKLVFALGGCAQGQAA